jgi:hypothetical protein
MSGIAGWVTKYAGWVTRYPRGSSVNTGTELVGNGLPTLRSDK